MVDHSKISRLSRRLSTAVLALMVIMPTALVAIWCFAPGDYLEMTMEMPFLGFSPTPLKRVLGIVILSVPVGIALFALYRLRSLFSLYAIGEYFSARAIVTLKGFSVVIFYAVIADIISSTVLVVAMTYDHPVGEKMIAFRISSTDLFMLLLSSVFLLISYIMNEAHDIAEENAQIV